MRYTIRWARLFALLLILHIPVFAVTDPLLDELLKRNGDVYLLLSDSGSGTGYLYMFDQSADYLQKDVIPAGNAVKAYLHQYVGFTVDKFGHVKLFRAKDDIDNPTGSTSILNASILARSYPGQAGTVPTGTNTMNIPGSTAIQATAAGWRYVISPDGKEGWRRVMTDVNGGNVDATSGSFTLQEDPTLIPPGSTILPPYFKSMPFEYFLSYHNGFWQGGRDGFRVQHADAPGTIISVTHTYSCCSGSGDNFSFTVPLYDIPYDVGEELWGIGPTAGVKLSPPIGAFFFIPHFNGSWQYDWGTYRAATNVRGAKKNVKTLLVNTFLSENDNNTMMNNAGSSSVFTDLDLGRDFFSGVGANGYSDISDQVLANTVSFSVDAGRWNHCGDLCGLGPSASSASPPPPPSSRAYASSFGENQSQQKLYMIKRASFGGQKVVTTVVEIRVTATGNQQADLVEDGNTYPSTHVLDNYPLEGKNLGENDSNFSDLTRQVVYKVFADDLGVSSAGLPDYAQALGFSKRRDGTTDYVYYTNLPATHFTVSSNFWGTGGTIWYAEETGGNLNIRFRTYNHTGLNDFRPGDIVGEEDRMPLKAMAADGDSNVYIVHSKDAYDRPETMDALFSGGVDKVSITTYCDNGRITNCTEIGVGSRNICQNGVAQNPSTIPIRTKQYAGFVTEKLSPLAGSKPRILGVIPNVEIGTCQTNAYFPLSASEISSCIFNADRPAASTDPWTCSASGAGGVDLSNVNVELAVINVPNPPASGSRGTDIQIVYPCNAMGAPQACDGDNLIEDQNYTFRMENPPHFAGVPAVLGQSADGILKAMGTVEMISNYSDTGIDYAKEQPLSDPDGDVGTVEDLFFDDKAPEGVMVSSLLNEDYKPNPMNELMNPQVGLAGSPVNAQRTMRYRWQVRALSPPHSLVDYTAHNLPGTSNKVIVDCVPIKNPSGARITSGPQPVYEYPDKEDPSLINRFGLMHDTCWQDMNRMIATDSEGREIYAPKNLDFKFFDPGDYEVTLLVGALGFDLDGITYLSDPAAVQAMIIVTHNTQMVTVGAKNPAPNPFVYDVKVAANDQASPASLRVGERLGSSDYKALFGSNNTNGRYHGPLGSLPVEAVHYYPSERLVVTHQDQLTPIYAEANIQFYNLTKTGYLLNPNDDTKQDRTEGVGSWDFEYECTSSTLNPSSASYTGSCGLIGGMPLVDKSSTHPSNWGMSSTGALQYTSGYGNDASGLAKGRGSSRLILNDGSVLESSNFDALHQGTISKSSYYPDDPNIEKSAYSFYTWYDIKYAWFMRYKTPQNEVKERIIRTGNLAEIFLLNFYAHHFGGNKSVYQNLIREIAPVELAGSGTSIPAGQLIRAGLPTTRSRQIRIPLLNNNALFTGDVTEEMNGQLRDDLNTDAAFQGQSLASLLEKIHPMKLPIPTGATVLELSFQLFAPVITYKGQDEVKDANGNPTGQFAYFDVVAGKVDSAGAVTPIDNFTDLKANYTFGETIVSWATRGTLKNSYGSLPKLDSGLQLASDPGGFSIANDGSASFTGRNDHFVEIFVSDLENPSLTLDSGDGQTLIAGQANLQPIVLTARDNAPFSHWLDYDPTGAADKHEGIPTLSNFYYAMGFDPRNLRGLGLLDPKSYSFHISHKEFNPDNNAAFARTGFEKLAEIYPDQSNSPVQPSGYDLNSVASDFFAFDLGSGGNRTNDRFFNSATWMNPAKVDDYAAEKSAGFYWNRKVDEESLFTNPGEMNPVFTDTTASTPLPIKYQYLAPHFTGTNLFSFPTESSNLNRRKIVITDEDEGTSCLSTALPQMEDPANCWKSTTFEVQDGSVFAPHFFNNDYSKSWGVYGAAQDARIYANYTAAGPSPSSQPVNSYHFRLTGKSNTPANPADFNSKSSHSAIREEAQKQAHFHEAEYLTNFSYEDETPPNLRVSITDFKTRLSSYFVVTMIQSVEKDGGADNVISYTPRVDVYRNVDPRGPLDTTGNNFRATKIAKTYQARKTPNEYRVSEYSDDPDNGSDFFFEIPEDTRFQVHAAFSDNVTSQFLEGNIKIESGTCAGTSKDITGYGLDPLTGVYADYKIPTREKSPANQYRDLADLRVNHLYPQHGYYDEIKVTATDVNGNPTAICIPVKVIPQDVHFRQLGEESRVK